MIKSVLVIVPHQDDELNIAGGLFETLIDNNIDINVLYVTRGDFYKEKYEFRQKERDEVLKVFGNIKYKQLNYSDNYKSDNHIFNNLDTRNKVKDDIKAYILEVLADMIICIDFDEHADHRMVSSLFDEIIKEIVTSSNYRPIVLKKFAYLGVWGGENDYFSSVALSTKPYLKISNDIYTNALPYSWNERLRFKANNIDYALDFYNSKLYKAYARYMTQCGFRFFFHASNSDIVYFYRNTNNLALLAEVKVSDGDGHYINDYALANIESIKDNFIGTSKFDTSAWIPNDKEKKATLKWKKPNDIKSIKLYQNFKYEGHINSFEISLSNGYKKLINCSNDDIEVVDLGLNKDVDSLTFKILDGSGKAGIRELEVYSDDNKFPKEETPFEYYVDDVEERNNVKYYENIAKLYWVYYRAKNKFNKLIHKNNWD